jgi:Mitochondrial carrier protein
VSLHNPTRLLQTVTASHSYRHLRMDFQVRLQSKENRQRGPVVVIREVVREHGVRGLWRGTTPAAVGTADLLRCALVR